jgi:hypothetical protein
MCHLQEKSALMRNVGTWEYGLRDVDLLCVPTPSLSTYDEYVQECDLFVTWFDDQMNRAKKDADGARRWWELTQASSDFSV